MCPYSDRYSLPLIAPALYDPEARWYMLGDSAKVAVFVVFSWAIACYPTYKMEQLRRSTKGVTASGFTEMV